MIFEGKQIKLCSDMSSERVYYHYNMKININVTEYC